MTKLPNKMLNVVNIYIWPKFIFFLKLNNKIYPTFCDFCQYYLKKSNYIILYYIYIYKYIYIYIYI